MPTCMYVIIQEIDAYIAKASEQGYHTALRLGSRGISFASDFVLKAAVKVLLRYTVD